MRPTNKLTELVVRQAKTADKQRKLSDGGGLCLLLHPNGGKYWRLDYRFEGRRKTLSFGVWPEVSLIEARKGRDAAREKLRKGTDPVEDRRGRKRITIKEQLAQKQAKIKQATTFKKVSLDWIKRQAPRWTEKHSFDVLRALENHVFPYIGDLPLEDISKRQVLDVLRLMESQGKHEAAHRARQRMESVFRYGIQTDICKDNPAADLKGVLTPPKREKQAALAPEELPEFLKKLTEYDGHPQTRLAMWFMIYTFVRSAELRFAEWTEIAIDCDEPQWIIPAERMKMRREHVVPLAFQAVDVLEQMQEFSGDERLVCPGHNNPNRPMSENTLLYALYRMGYHSRATTHGFRATASTILNESGKWHPDAIEKQLAHVEGNKVRAAYNRAEHLDERRRLMQWWADHLDSLMVPADVISLDERRNSG